MGVNPGNWSLGNLRCWEGELTLLVYQFQESAAIQHEATASEHVWIGKETADMLSLWRVG